MPKKDNAETKAQREQRELHERRDKQLEEARAALETLNRDLSATQTTLRRCDALSDHSGGFYEEMNKLAKGKAMLAVTDLMVEDANNIIRDAKVIVTKDVYLDRVKEFVPAGDNPVYPDVVVGIRSVRDSVARFRKELETQRDVLKAKLQKAKTLIGALEYFLDDDVEVEDEDEKDYPTKEAIANYVDGPVSTSCLSTFEDSYDQYFDFDRLDEQTIPEYLAITDSTPQISAEADEETQVADSEEEDPVAEAEEGEGSET